MAVPVLNLNLAPRPGLWRQYHQTFGWLALAFGSLFLLGSLGFTWRAYHQAGRAGREAVSLTEQARRAASQEQQLENSLQSMDATKEQSRWKLAERILLERSLPWSRITAELEQCMVPDMRLKGFQRARTTGQQVVMKLKGEARTREAEALFVEALRSAPVFAQVVLERESERQGGGWDFEVSLPVASIPPAFHAKPVTQRAVAASNPAPVAPPKLASSPVPATPLKPAPAPAPERLAPPPSNPQAPLIQGAPEGFRSRPAPPSRPSRVRPRPDPRDDRSSE